MAETLDEIGAAVPCGALRRIRGEGLGFMEQRVPAGHQRANIKRDGEGGLRSFGADRRLGHQMGIERLEVGLGGFGKGRIGKRRIEMPAVARDTFAHRSCKGRIGPGADAGLGIRRDVGGIDGAEGRLDRPATGIGRAVGGGVADGAVAEGGEQAAAFEGFGGID